MSWSVGPTNGRPGAVKKSLAGQFSSAKVNNAHFPHELASIEAAESLVNAQLDFMVEQKYPAVTVSASGSASTATFQGGGASSIKVEVAPTWCFLEDEPQPQPEPTKVETPAAA